MGSNRLYGRLFFLLLIFFGSRNSYAFSETGPIVSSDKIKLIENKGQWDPKVLFKAAIPGGDLYITSQGFFYALVDEQALHEINHGRSAATSVKAHNYTMLFKGGNTSVSVRKGDSFSEYYNYFIGNDPAKWASKCRAYEQVILENIYNGIDAEIIAEKDFIKLNFIVKPFADPSKIRLIYTGQDELALKEGALHIETSVANIKEEKPFAYQNNREVSCHYELNNTEVSFDLGEYNPGSALVIDPNIIFSTFSGSVADNFGFTAAFDASGNGFAGGTVFSSGFPVTTGAYQLIFKGGTGNARDAGILKFSSDGKQLLYATYLGGNDNEQPHSIICNAAGDLYILGTTYSANFPSTALAYDRFYNGGADIFISRLSSDGTILRNSTFWGGAMDDGINGQDPEVWGYRSSNPLTYNYGDFFRGEIKLDKNENVYVASTTQSTTGDGYPTFNGFQSTYGGGTQDGCLFKLTPNLASLYFSTYIGGSDADAAYGIGFDELAGNIFVCGGTASANLGKQQGLLDYKGDADGFVAKIGFFGNTLQKLVYVGSSKYDQAYFIDIDSKNSIYITGQTMGNDFPIKGPVYSNSKSKQFITTLDNNLDSIQLSTVIGSVNSVFPDVSPAAFMVDDCGRVYFSGWGGSVNNIFNPSTGNTLGMPLTSGAFQSTSDGSDFYLAVLSKDLANLEYATYFGGRLSEEHVDGGTSRFDKKGVVYQSVCAGCGGFSDLPTTPDAYSTINRGIRPNTTNVGGCNNALFKFNMNLSDRPPVVKDTFISIIATDTLNYVFDITDPDGDSVQATITGTVFNIPLNPPTVSSVRMKDRVRTTLTWKTLCSHASPDTVVIDLTGTDNACIQANSASGKIKLLVTRPPVLDPPYPQCLQTISDSTVKLKWQAPPSLGHFKQYIIYKKSGNGPFAVFTSLTNPADTELLDTAAYNHLSLNYCYFIQTANTCNAVSIPSRTICSLFQSDTSLPAFRLTKDTTLFVMASDTLDYTFEASAVNPQDSLSLSAGGNIFGSGRVLSSTIVPDLQKVRYSFKWRSICDDIARTDTFYFDLLVRNNECPQSRTQKARIKVVVIHPPVDPAPVMRCTRSISGNTTLVRWEKPTPGKYFSYYVLIRKSPDGSWTQLAESHNDDALTFTDNDATGNAQNDFCYTAYAVNICGDHGDTALLSCSVIKNITAPQPIYIYNTSVENNQYLTLSWEKSKETDFLKYKVLKQETQSGTSFSAYHEFTNINDTFMTDENVDVQKSVYCYQIKQVNDCGAENIDAYRSCSILLKGVSVPFKHSLSWNDYDYWKNGTKEYAIMKQEPGESPVQIGSSYYKNPKGVHDKLNIENGLYHYTIIASELNSPFKSISNTIELIQSPLLHAPNAFTPNGDNLNDTWDPAPVFVKDYDLKLYDRWGQLVFQTNDKHQHFKDEFLNDPMTCDVLVYLITYTGWDGSSHIQKGNVTILK